MTQAADSSPPGEYYCASCEKTFTLQGSCPNDGTKLIKVRLGLDPFLGREIDGKYTVLERLGHGGMGAVYRGVQHSMGREVAIKVVTPHLVADADVIKRFLREAKLASRLAHPNAVGVIDFGQAEDGLFYLVMELVTGRTLDAVIKADGVFRPERLARIATQVCDALECAHELQIIHRDLKPANIMLLASGRDLVKVLDFGLAKSLAPDQSVSTMTNAGELLGTPAFLPPEIAFGQPCDGRADLYSLGCILYLMAAGRLPFISESAHELVAMQASDPPPPLPSTVAPPLAHAILRLLEKAPADRFQTAAQAREALEAACDARIATPLPFTIPLSSPAMSGAIPAGAPAPIASAVSVVHGKTARRRGRAVTIGAVVAALAASLVVFAITRDHPDAPPSPPPQSIVMQPEPAPPTTAPAPAPPIVEPAAAAPSVPSGSAAPSSPHAPAGRPAVVHAPSTPHPHTIAPPAPQPAPAKPVPTRGSGDLPF